MDLKYDEFLFLSLMRDLVPGLGEMEYDIFYELGSGEYSKITKFDLAEYRDYAKSIDRIPFKHLEEDILMLGYWCETKEGTLKYEEPAHDWREELDQKQIKHDL